MVRTSTKATRALAYAAGLAALLAGSAQAQSAATGAGTETPQIRVATIDGAAAGRPDTPSLDHDLMQRALAAYRKGNLAEGDPLRAQISDPTALAILDWVALRSGANLGFERIDAFLQANPDWPVTAQVRRRAEEALFGARKPAGAVRAYFAERAPASGAGRLALAFALRAEGRQAEAASLIRQSWREDSFGGEMEEKILELFPDLITKADHRHRMERFLFRESLTSALRAAGYAGKDYVLLAKARIAVKAGGRKAEKALAAVPPHLRTEPSYKFARAQFLKRKDKDLEAAEAIAGVPRDPEILVDGDEWWDLRRALARNLLDAKEFAAAYRVAREHGAASPAQRIEAEFHAGWIALRFLDDPAAAERHFAAAGEIAETPISVARAAYWQARAAEAAGREDAAREHLIRAAGNPIAYYGQLARQKLGLDPVEIRTPEVFGESRTAFRNLRPVQALQLLHAMGAEDLTVALYADLAQKLADVAQLDALGALAAHHGSARAALVVGKSAVQRGLPLDRHAYPVFGIPSFPMLADQVDHAMVYAISRQESAFNPAAQSHAGARGLMQLMPATAKRTAQRFGVDFKLDRLTEDPTYNAKIGAAHLGELMDDWRGSYVLAFASYNAGGGNVRKWIKAYGDPRSPGVDQVDWVERIPFSETRNYVQRVLENLSIYRERLAGTSPGAPVPATATAFAEP